MNYRTPGVYVEEIKLFPPSVAAVGTAIPAFISYTEEAKDDDENDITTFPYIKRIKSLKEYETYFGFARSQAITVNVANNEPATVNAISDSNYKLYYSLQMYFDNGGGPCYIVSVGKYNNAETISGAGLLSGLAAVKKKDEPTLIIFPDGVGMSSNTGYYDVLKQALFQCKDLGDRFTICDMHNDSDVDNFRTNIGTNNLKYGGAYHPWLKTNLNYRIEKRTVTFNAPGAPDNLNVSLNGNTWGEIVGVTVLHNNNEDLIKVQTSITITKVNIDIVLVDLAAATDDATAIAKAIEAAQSTVDIATMVLNAINAVGADNSDITDALADANAALTDALTATDIASAQDSATDNDLQQSADDVITEIGDAVTAAGTALTAALAALTIPVVNITDITVIFNNDFETKLEALIAKQYLTMPPSSVMAGVYAMVDRTRGVWKAPANVSLNRVIAPSAKISDADQENLNVDTNGKSINAIRAFTGKGVMVWGARTLAGNDNEWRYISVRRFFNMVEESVKKASEGFVFEPNDANTWVKVRAMIENFLTLQWRAGALAGAVPEDAFYVHVGLGKTMTALDILEGRMNVEIGMAVVRPAEFIILKFSHKMQES